VGLGAQRTLVCMPPPPSLLFMALRDGAATTSWFYANDKGASQGSNSIVGPGRRYLTVPFGNREVDDEVDDAEHREQPEEVVTCPRLSLSGIHLRPPFLVVTAVTMDTSSALR
jgi:hypothetical protein